MFSADLGGAPPAAAPAATDPPFQKVALLLHGDGTNGAQNNTFVDYSYPGGYAVSFDGSGDYLQTSGSVSLSGSFTIEGWINLSSAQANWRMLCGQSIGSSGQYLSVTSSGLEMQFSAGVSTIASCSFSFVVGTWYHVAVVRNGTTVTFYVDGVAKTTANSTQSATFVTSYVGVGYSTSYVFNGFISNFRINTNALYTSNFTPSNLPLTAVSGTSLLTCQSATIVDNSPNAFTITANGNAAAVSSKTITRTGNVAQGTFSPFSLPEGQWSNYFDGTNYLTTPNSAFTALGTNDWTVEFWVYPLAASAGTVFANNANGIGFQFDCQAGVGATRIRFTIDGGNTKQMDATGVNMNVWTHFAMVRSGNNLYMYVNGTRVTSSTTTASIANSATLSYIGNGYGSSLFNGYISNLRMINGTAIYSGASLTVPTAPLTAVTNTKFLTCQSNRFVDNSTTNATFTTSGSPKVTAFSPFAPSAAYSASTNGGSAYFDGSGDYLTVPANTSAFQFGTGDFCLECFYYYVPGNAYNTFFNNGFINGYVCRASGGTPNLYTNGAQVITSSVDCQSYAWNHVAFCRVGSTFSIFLNGVRTATITYSSSIPGAYAVDVGFDSQYYLKGYLSNNRIVKGSSPYDPTQSSIAVPTTPLTAVANTQLLLNCTNAGILDNAGKNDIETVGNAQISTSVKKYGTGSMYFDGTGDYLVNQGNIDSFIFGTGDWTIEFWLYLNSLPAANAFVLDFRPTSTQGVYPTIYITSAGNLVFFVSSGLRINASAAIAAGAWQHVAICKSSGSTKAFVNGTQVGSTYTDTYSYICGANRPSIASNGFTLNNNLLTGYIDDLRITKGQALYTANFTPPTQAFPNV